MALTYRSTKGSDLTPSECDANTAEIESVKNLINGHQASHNAGADEIPVLDANGILYMSTKKAIEPSVNGSYGPSFGNKNQDYTSIYSGVGANLCTNCYFDGVNWRSIAAGSSYILSATQNNGGGAVLYTASPIPSAADQIISWSSASLNAPTNSVIGHGFSSISSYLACTTNIPIDDTIPVITEGTQVLSLSYAASRANSKLIIAVSILGTTSAAASAAAALFNGATNAIAATYGSSSSAAGGVPLNFKCEVTPNTTNAVVYTVRAGLHTGQGTYHFNGSTGGRIFGGVAASSIEITEYLQV